MSNGNNQHVVFGTGPIGTNLATLLVKEGKSVRAVNRSGKANMPEGVELIAADATNPDVVRDLCQDAAVVYNCVNVPYIQQAEILPLFQKAMIAGASAAGARLVVTDTLYMYGETHGTPITENTPHAATTRKGRLRAEIAKNYLDADARGEVQIAIGRAADFFGPYVYNSVLGERVFPPALAGQPVLVMGDIDLPHSFSYSLDVARGLAVLGERPEASGKGWLLPVASTVTTRQICDLISQALGHPIQIQAASKSDIEAMAPLDSQIAEFVEMFYQYTEPQIVDSSNFEQTFGIKATPLDQAIPATVDWFQGH